MRWTEQAPGLPVHRLADARGRDATIDAALDATAVTAAGVVVAIFAAAVQEALRHVSGHDQERGGLLLGEVYAEQAEVHLTRLVVVTQAVPAVHSAATGFSLRMDTDVWGHARARLAPSERVTGWYHSHPRLGAFFSHTDRRTQQAFFPHPYSVGWVIDPDQQQWALFVGADSTDPAASVYGVPGWGASVSAEGLR